MRTSFALLHKQCKDSLCNLPTLMILVIYPAVAFVMITAIGAQEGTSQMFVSMFATMHCCFAPATVAANILAEEKEKGTLRSLLLSGVGRVNYLVSLSVFVIFAALLTGSTFLLMDSFDRAYLSAFWIAMSAGAVISTLLGLCIGILSRNTAAANGMAVPVGLVFSLLPMLAQFNDTIAKAAKLLYSGHISLLLGGSSASWQTAAVLFTYFAIGAVGVTALFQKKGLE